MTKAFDEATYRQDFEAINGRQPSEEELEHAKYLVDRYIVGKDDDSGVVTYHPIKRSLFKALLGSTFGWIRRGGVFLVMTPVFLTKLFFNLIGSTIGVFVIWFVSKLMLGFIFMGIVFLCDQAAFSEPEKNIRSTTRCWHFPLWREVLYLRCAKLFPSSYSRCVDYWDCHRGLCL